MKKTYSNLSSLASVGVACWLQRLNDNICMDDAVNVASYALKLAYCMYAPPGEQIDIAFLRTDGHLVWVGDIHNHIISNVVYMISVRHSPTDDFLHSAGVLFTQKRVFLHATPIAINDQTPCAIGSLPNFIHSVSRICCTTGERVRDREIYKYMSPFIKTLPLR